MTGSAPFGYGDGDEATVLSYGPAVTNKFITTYFRRAFTVANTSVIHALTLRLLRDDGAVVYLNGAEVFRSNMPDRCSQCDHAGHKRGERQGGNDAVPERSARSGAADQWKQFCYRGNSPKQREQYGHQF